MLEQTLAAQMPVEGAQAGGLALQRGGRDRRPLPGAVGELGEKRREVAMTNVERAHTAATQKLPELQQIDAVGLQRVAREPALELQIGEEVEHEALDARAG